MSNKKCLINVLVWGYVIGVCIYHGLYIWEIYNDPKQELSFLALNDLGDFLSGFFAPLAFVFLYKNYKQLQEQLEISIYPLLYIIDDTDEQELEQGQEKKIYLSNIGEPVAIRAKILNIKENREEDFFPLKKPILKNDEKIELMSLIKKVVNKYPEEYSKECGKMHDPAFIIYGTTLKFYCRTKVGTYEKSLMIKYNIVPNTEDIKYYSHEWL